MSSESVQENISETDVTEEAVAESVATDESTAENAEVAAETMATTTASDDEEQAASESETELAEPDSAAPMFTAAPLNEQKIQNILEAALMAAGQPLSIDRMLNLFLDANQPSRDEIRGALAVLAEACESRGVELVEVGSGFRYQAKQENAEWVARLWEEKPARYSRALLETLALIAYRQPITRGEIEDIRGVSVSTNIMKTLMERDWVKVVGHRDVPGKPAMYASTKQFLDYFSLKTLSDLPSLAEIRDIDSINAELDLAEPDADKRSSDTDAEAQLDLAANDAAETDVGDDTGEGVAALSADDENSDGQTSVEADAEQAVEESADISVEESTEELAAESSDTEPSDNEHPVTAEDTTPSADPT